MAYEDRHRELREADATAVDAVVVMADDRKPGLALLADMAAWNDRRKAQLAALDEASGSGEVGRG